MDIRSLTILSCTIMATAAWSYYPVPRAPMRFTRFARLPPSLGHRAPLQIPVREEQQEQPTWRAKRNHHDYDNHDYDHDNNHDNYDHGDTSGVTGPIHTFVKTDKNANYKWGVRHHVGNKYAS